MKTPERITADTAKRIEEVTMKYLKDTPVKIRKLRELRVPSAIDEPLSKQDLADMTGVGAQNIGKIEKHYGEPHSLNASIKFLIKIAVIFDVSLDYLVGLSEDTQRPARKQRPAKRNAMIDEIIEKLSMMKA